jgi:hypothetical protein
MIEIRLIIKGKIKIDSIYQCNGTSAIAEYRYLSSNSGYIKLKKIDLVNNIVS